MTSLTTQCERPIEPPPIIRGIWGPCRFVLPAALIDAVARELKHLPIDQSIFEADQHLAQQVAARPSLVGFWHDHPINHDLLGEAEAPSSNRITDAEIRELGWDALGFTSGKVQAALEGMDEPYRWIRRGRRAYCGWLSCNAKFVAEHDALWAASRTLLEPHGIPLMGPSLPSPEAVPGATLADEPLRGLLSTFEAFLRRWDLAQLPGPRLPYPFGSQTPMLGNGLQPGHGERATATVQVARTLPSMPGEMLRQQLGNAQQPSQVGEHLTPWMKIIAKGNTGRQTLDRYERLFPLQHYWRLVHERYDSAIHGALGRLKFAMAKFLGVSRDAIHDDLLFIRRQLGPGWHLPPTPAEE